MDDVEVPAVCELYDDRRQIGVDMVADSGRQKVEGYDDYRKILEREDIDAVIIPSSWTAHTEMQLLQ